jgi:hypothetical protein
MSSPRTRQLWRWQTILVRAVGRLLADEHRQWADALAAEVNAAPNGQDAIAIAVSGCTGLARIALTRGFVEWRSPLTVLLSAVGFSVVTATVDLNSGTRWPLRTSVIVCSLVCGAMAPRVAAVSGALIGSGVAITAAATGFPPPYSHDRGDVWIPLLPSIVLALAAARMAKRVRQRV